MDGFLITKKDYEKALIYNSKLFDIKKQINDLYDKIKERKEFMECLTDEMSNTEKFICNHIILKNRQLKF